MAEPSSNGNGAPGATWEDAARRTVQADVRHPIGGSIFPGAGVETMVLQFASIADDIPAWGANPWLRDRYLRDIWPREPLLASTVYTIAARNASLNWALRGPTAVTEPLLETFHQADIGRGWISWAVKISIDYLTQDNAAFGELIRMEKRPDSPLIGIGHLDAGMCIRTGNWEQPVIYTDLDGRMHLLNWWEMFEMVEFPSPIQRMRGMQYCAVTRILQAAQLARDIMTYKREKASGRFRRAVHLISGFTQQMIKDQFALANVASDNQGLLRYGEPVIMANPDPSATIQHLQIDLASLPDNFDEQIWFTHYVAGLAAAFGADYQDIAPLPGGNLGTSTQSQVLHLKSKGKGPALWMKNLEHKLNFHGAVPRNCKFEYQEHDTVQEKDEAELAGMRMRAIEAFVRAFTPPSLAQGAGGQGGGGGAGGDSGAETAQKPAQSGQSSGDGKEFRRGSLPSNADGIVAGTELTPAQYVAAQILNDWGMLRTEYLSLLGISDLSPDKIIADSGDVRQQLVGGARGDGA